MILRIILGAIIFIIGFLIVWKSEWLLSNFGRVEWAERKLSGGTRIFHKLLGLLIILIGFSVITNLFSAIMRAFVGLLVPNSL